MRSLRMTVIQALLIAEMQILSSCHTDEPCIDCPVNDGLITSERELADGLEPAVSPDGTKIAYTNSGDVFVMDTSGANITQLTSGPEIDVLPRWHPSGQSVGFMRLVQQTDDTGKLFRVPLAGGASMETPTTHQPSNALKRQSEIYSGVTVPLWDFSPDGKYIAFLCKYSTKTYLSSVSAADGKELFFRAISDDAGQSVGNLSGFVWSLNSDEICFISQDSSGHGSVSLHNILSHIEVIDSTLNGPTQLTRSSLNNKFACVATDSQSGQGVINVISFGLSHTTYGILGGGGLKWSPDERYFVFDWQQTVGGPFGYRYSQLYVISVEKNKEFSLTSRGDINRINLHFEWGKSPNTVFFERFGRICEVSFRSPQ
ncbi:MAG: hypothetical protein WBD36_03220 [Bacteroidota bacterium]